MTSSMRPRRHACSSLTISIRCRGMQTRTLIVGYSSSTSSSDPTLSTTSALCKSTKKAKYYRSKMSSLCNSNKREPTSSKCEVKIAARMMRYARLLANLSGRRMSLRRRSHPLRPRTRCARPNYRARSSWRT